ncbi:MAG: tyrosine-type recombinase/integrase [Candidatus Nitrosopolaris sp.]
MARKAIDRSLLQGETIEQFRAAIRNPITRDQYERRLIGFLKTVKMTPDEFVAKAKSRRHAIEKIVISFISAENNRVENREVTAGTVGNIIKAVKTLLEMNDVTSVNWKKIKRVLPKVRRYALDRVPTINEIQNIVEAADIRGKALTPVFISSGTREGAIKQLKVGDYTRTEGVGRLTVYNGDPERYVSFISPEACNALDKYLTFRREHGEMISADSPLFRDKFDPIKRQEGTGHHGHTRRDAKEIVIPMTGPSIRQYYNRLLFSIGIRKDKKRRHEFSVHGLRKYFKTRAEQSGMKPINVEILMGHSVGISDSYYRPTETEIVQDYLKAVDALTMSQEKQLRHAVEKLKVENAEIDIMKKCYLDMRLTVENKDKEVHRLNDTVKLLITNQTDMSRRLYEAGILKKD